MPLVPIDSITVPERLRKKVGKDFPGLKANIKFLGFLINPITVNREHVLSTGGKRLQACKELGWAHIEVTYLEDLPPEMQELVEWAENEHRGGFTPRERHNGLINIYNRLKQKNPNVTDVEVGEFCSLTKNSIFQHRLVEKWRKLDRLVDAALDESLQTALGKAQNAEKQWKEDQEAKASYAAALGATMLNSTSAGNGSGAGNAANSADPIPSGDGEIISPTHPLKVSYRPIEIITADFCEWAPAYAGPKFNLIHCDFPYGINSHNHAGQNSANQDKYWDSPETRDRLYRTFVTHLDRFCTSHAHLIFWFSPEHYCEVLKMLRGLPGFQIDEHPLIWQRGKNEGVARRPRNEPRHIYEMAFFGWRNGRTLGTAGPKANLYPSPTDREYHPHEKSQEMLEHFFSMVVGSGTRLLDPTAGSGSALRAAQSLGVTQMLGIEIDDEYAARARLNLVPVYQGAEDFDLAEVGL